MKKRLILAAISVAIPTEIFAQSTVLAHWDSKDGQGRLFSLEPEDNGIHCITPRDIDRGDLIYSWVTEDSEDGSANGANCYIGWDASDSVIYGVNFANDAVVDVQQINFDIGNYGAERLVNGVPVFTNRIELRVWKNGTEITTPGQFTKSLVDGLVDDPWTASSDTTFDVSGLGITSANGSSDDYEFAIYQTEGFYRIAVDNFRVIGSHTCVPEPSSVALLALGVLGLSVRRRR